MQMSLSVAQMPSCPFSARISYQFSYNGWGFLIVNRFYLSVELRFDILERAHFIEEFSIFVSLN